RRPISTKPSSPPFASRSCPSAAIAFSMQGEAKWMRLSRWYRRRSTPGCNAPRSMPWGTPLSFSRLRPSDQGRKRSPYGPSRSSRFKNPVGVQRTPRGRSQRSGRSSQGSPIGPPPSRSLSSSKISQSASSPSALSTTGGDQRAMLRTAREANSKSMWSSARFQHGGRNDVGMARGLVDVDVDRHHEVELVECGGEALPVGHGEHWIAGQRHHRADLAQNRGLDLVCKHGGGQINERLGQAQTTALTTVVA